MAAPPAFLNANNLPPQSVYQTTLPNYKQPIAGANLGNPRAPTTTLPPAVLASKPDNRYPPPRLPDRGALVPIGGQRQSLPDGQQGGVPRKPANLLAGLDRVFMIKANVSQGQTLALAIKKSVNAARAAQRPVFKLQLGNSGLKEAKRGPLRIDVRTGRAIYKAGLRDVRITKTIGQFAQQRNAPKSILDKFAGNRIDIPNVPVVNSGRAPRGVHALDTIPNTPAGDVLRMISTGSPILIPGQKDQGAEAVKPSAANAALSLGFGPNQNAAERMIFLGAAVFVAWLLFKR